MSASRAERRHSVIVGYGVAGRGLHHRTLCTLFGPEHSVLIVDPRFIGDPMGGAPWVASIADCMGALRSAGVDPSEAVFHVTTSPSIHLTCIEELVGSGARRIIVEKPMAGTWHDAERIAELGQGAEILPVSVWLASRVTEVVEEVLGSGAIGALRSLHMEQSKPRFRRTIRSDSHGSAFDIELPHQVLLALALAGPAERAVSVHTWPMQLPDRSITSMGGAVVRLLHETGVASTLVTDLTAPTRLRRLHLVGTRGEIVADYPVSGDDDFGQVRVSGRARRKVVQDAPLSRFVEQAYGYFSGAGAPPRGDVAMHLKCIALLESARQTAVPLAIDMEMIS